MKLENGVRVSRSKKSKHYALRKHFNMTEKEKYFEWFRKEKENGLIDVKICPNYENLSTPINEEVLYGELNRMNAAEAVQDFDLFPSGKYEY